MNPMLGTIQAFGFSFAPRGWASCDGQLMSIAANTALFSLLGTTYGGDGRTTFGLPDLRGRVPIHMGHGPGLSDRPWGQKSGAESSTLTTLNLPAHNHALVGTATGVQMVNSAAGQQDSPQGAIYATASDDNYTASANASGLANSVAVNTNGLSIGITGGSIPVNNLEPFLVLNWCIAQVGIFPSRN